MLVGDGGEPMKLVFGQHAEHEAAHVSLARGHHGEDEGLSDTRQM